MEIVQSFLFGETPIRVLGTHDAPLFILTDVCKALNLSQPSRVLARIDACDGFKVPVETAGGRQTVTVINESGLYTVVLRSDDAMKEDTVAYKFRRWVVSEVLPSIRKTGEYELPRDTITVEEQYCIRKAIAYNAKRTGRNFRDVYNGLYNEFQIPRYKELKREDFQKALEFLDVKFPEKKQAPTSAVVLNESEAKLLLTFIYVARYLFRGCFALTYQFLEQSRSPMTGIFYEFLMDPHLAVVEKILDEHGYSVSDLECYKHYVAQGYNH